MGIDDRARFWNVTAEERTLNLPCDHYLHEPYQAFVRAIDIEAAPDVLFRWPCQLKVAPYSYDWLDNGGRRSPRELTPGAEQLELGQKFLVFQIVEFEPNQHITGLIQDSFRPVYGTLTVTYAIRAQDAQHCRLLVRLDVAASSLWERVRCNLLAWGDLIMMRKQLLTLKQLAEAHADLSPPAA